MIKNLFYKWWDSGVNKVSEVQIYYLFTIGFILEFTLNPSSFGFNLFHIVSLDITKTSECDHAGIYFELNLFGLNILLSKYDTRHWDEDN